MKSLLLFLLLLMSCGVQEEPTADSPQKEPPKNGISLTRISIKQKNIENYGTLRQIDDPTKKVVLMLHQKNSNSHEFDDIAPLINSLGLDTLSIDLRSGGQLFGYANISVEVIGKPIQSFQFILKDVDNAISWLINNKYEDIILLGSCESAFLAIKLAMKFKQIKGIVAVSLGLRLDGEKIYSYINNLKKPVLLISSSKDKKKLNLIAEYAGRTEPTIHLSQANLTGAFIFRKDLNTEEYSNDIKPLIKFLK